MENKERNGGKNESAVISREELMREYPGVIEALDDGEINTIRLLVPNILADMVRLSRRYEAALEEGMTDGLTGLYNRAVFDRDMGKACSMARRMREPVSLVMIDADHFKNVNDDFGHTAGDYVLKKLAQLFREACRRDTDSLCRYGGEEFGLILPDTGPRGAYNVAENIRERTNSIKIPNNDRKVTVSIGISYYAPLLEAEKTPEQLVEEADACLYKSKKNGRNRTTVANPLRCFCISPEQRTGFFHIHPDYIEISRFMEGRTPDRYTRISSHPKFRDFINDFGIYALMNGKKTYRKEGHTSSRNL